MVVLINPIAGSERVAVSAPVPDFARERKPRPDDPSKGGRKERSRGVRSSVGMDHSKEVGRAKETASKMGRKSEARTVYVSPITQEVAVSGSVKVVDAPDWGTLEVGYHLVDDGKTKFDLTDGQDLFGFVDKVSKLPKAKREVLGDLKLHACEEIGLGAQKKIVADAEMGGVVDKCVDDLMRVIKTKSFEPQDVQEVVGEILSNFRGTLSKLDDSIPGDLSGSKPLEASSISLILLAIAAKAAEYGNGKGNGKWRNAIIALSLLSLTLSTCTPKSPDYVVSADKIPVLADSFGNSVLKDEIKGVVDDPDLMLLTDKVDQTLKDSGYVDGKQYLIVGRSLQDVHGNKQPLVIGMIIGNNGEFVSPTPNSDQDSPPEPVLFFYAEGDGLTKLVPPGEGVDGAGGKMIPLQAWYDMGGNLVFGFATETGEGWKLMPVYRFEKEADGDGYDVVYRDPFSGLEYVADKAQDAPVIGEHIASLDPLFGLEDVMESQIDPEPIVEEAPSPREAAFSKLQEEGINVKHNVDDESGGWGVVVHGQDVPGVFFDEEGTFLTVDVDKLGDEPLKIPVDEVADRLDLSEEGVLTLKDADGKTMAAIGMSLTSENWGGQWFTKDEVLIPVDNMHDSALELGDSWVDFYDHMALEKQFLEPFHPEAKFPLGKIFLDYANRSLTSPTEFTPGDPFGILPNDQMHKSPFKGINCKILAPNKDEGREGWLIFFAEQVLDPKDLNNHQVLQFVQGITGPEELKGTKGRGGVCERAQSINFGYYILPKYRANGTYGDNPRNLEIVDLYKKNNLWDDGMMTPIETLTMQWLKSGTIPDELKSIPLFPDFFNLWLS